MEPYRKDLTVIAVESTYNWYWLVDGLEERGYTMVLAHPGQMQQYSGLKHADDRSDTFWMAEMLRLGILPTGHIYDRETRPLRDLLRRRMWLVQQRTDHLLSLISMITRHTGSRISTEACYKLDDEKRTLLTNQLVFLVLLATLFFCSVFFHICIRDMVIVEKYRIHVVREVTVHTAATPTF